MASENNTENNVKKITMAAIFTGAALFPSQAQQNTNQTQNDPQDIRSELKASSAEFNSKDFSIEDINTYIAKAEQLEKQLDEPCELIFADKSRVGNWNINNVSNTYNNKELDEMSPGTRKDKMTSPRNLIKNINFVNRDDVAPEYENATAYYSYTTDSISVIKNECSDLSSKKQIEYQYQNGNTIAQMAIVLHEIVHKYHSNHCNMGTPADTPKNAAKINRLTEEIAYAAEYLTIANLYTELSKQNIKNFQYTANISGKDTTIVMPLENILDMYPGLRETVEQNGFDANNPQSIRNVVETASKNWKEHQALSYIDQEKNAVASSLIIQQELRFSERVENIKNETKNYEKKSSAMLKNIYIGRGNTTVDLSHCRDLLDTMSDHTANNRLENTVSSLQENNISFVSDQDILTINSYLESKGITKAKDKDEYLEKQYKNIITRSPEADKELEKLLSGDKPITYADGLTVAKIANTGFKTVSDEHKNIYIIGAGAFIKPENINEKTNTKETTTQQKNNQQYIKNQGR